MFGWWSSPATQGIGATGEENSGKRDATEKSSPDQSDKKNGELGEKTSASQLKEGSETEDNKDKHSEIDFAKDVAKNVGSLLFSFASAATTTAYKVKDSVKDTVEKQTFIGSFNKEQEQFLKEKQSRRTAAIIMALSVYPIDAAVPPWVGYNEEEAMKTQILALSSDERNFLRDPPAGVPFHFDCDTMFPVAMAVLAEDQNLSEMRFKLVPKKVTEEKFWRNYFYRVSLIKQSTQLTSLAAATGNSSANTSEKVNSEADNKKDVQSSGESLAKDIHQSSKPSSQLEDNLPPDSPPLQEHEFASDEHQEGLQSELSRDDLRQIGVERLQASQDNTTEKDGALPSKKASAEAVADEDVPEWEKELQQELQDYEVVEGEDNAAWEREIEDMLKAES